MSDQEQLEKIRFACKHNLQFLCTQFFGLDKLWGAVHDDIEKVLLSASKRKLILVPRGHMKSMVVTKAYTIQRILKNPNIRVLIAHEVWDRSRDMLHEIKEYLTTKSVLPQLFGQFESQRWNADAITIRQRTKALSAPTISTTGVEAEMTSSHYDLIIADDLQGLQNSQTPDQRAKVKKFYRSLIDLLDPGATMIVVGTRWNMDDIYAHILENEAEYYDVMVRKVVEDGKIIFPEQFSKRFDAKKKDWVHVPEGCLDYIQYLKRSKGSEFYAQYENNPIDEENQIFKKGYFQYWTKRPEALYLSLTVDLAISQKQEADYTALMVCGMDPAFNIYVMDYVRGKWGPSDIVRNIFQMQEKWRPNAVGMEVNGFQRTLKFACEEEMRRRRHYFPITEIKTSNQTTKEFRIKALEPFYRDMKVYHAAWMRGKDLEDELLAFPRGKNDDLIDALSFQLQLLVPGHEVHRNDVPLGCWEAVAREAKKAMTPYRSFFEHG